MMALDKANRRSSQSEAADQTKRINRSAFPGGPAGPPPDNNGGGSGDDQYPFNEACILVQVNLAAYQDGELDPDTFNLVDDHASRCNRCAAMLSSMQEMDKQIEREWRENSPLPTSFQVQTSIDKIMAQLPQEPQVQQEFTPKRVHARVRWMRFSTGVMGVIALITMLWSSYRLGYSQGKELSGAKTPSAIPTPTYIPMKHSSPRQLTEAFLKSSI